MKPEQEPNLEQEELEHEEEFEQEMNLNQGEELEEKPTTRSWWARAKPFCFVGLGIGLLLLLLNALAVISVSPDLVFTVMLLGVMIIFVGNRRP